MLTRLPQEIEIGISASRSGSGGEEKRSEKPALAGGGIVAERAADVSSGAGGAGLEGGGAGRAGGGPGRGGGLLGGSLGRPKISENRK